MEKRKIIVVSSATQSQVAFESDATTLGQLKQELATRGVDYSGMTFLEGHSKLEMNLDDAILPTNIPYKGSVTNDLVFLLTAPQKKIKSGVDRCTVYGIIRDKNLADKIEEKFHKNFTNVSTSSLVDFLKSIFEDSKSSDNNEGGEEEKQHNNCKYDPENTSCTINCENEDKEDDDDEDGANDMIEGLKLLIKGMTKLGYVSNAHVEFPDEHQILSDDELKELFGEF